MANLDVNYLNELRQTFSSANHQNQVPTKGKKKQKYKSKPKITLPPKVSSNTQCNGTTTDTINDKPHYINGKNPDKGTKKQLFEVEDENNELRHQNEASLKGKKKLRSQLTFPEATNSNAQSSEKIKNRIDTPFKVKKTNHDENPVKGRQLSVSKHENNPLQHTFSNQNKQVKSKKKLKSKFTFSETTNFGTQSSEKIKNRIDTPFKLKNVSLHDKNPGRGTKRRLSDAEQEVKLKKKKEKPTISKGVQLNFSEDETKNTTEDEEFIETRKEKPKIKRKVQSRVNSEVNVSEKGKKKKLSWTLKTEAVEEKKRKSSLGVTGKKKKAKFENLIPVRPSERKNKINGEAQQYENFPISINNPETAHDFYDNNKLNVTGMNLQRFCNLFTDSYDEHFSEFKVPKKFYKTSKKDNQKLNMGAVENKKIREKQIEQKQIIEFDETTVNEDNTESDNEIVSNEIIESNPPKILKLTNNSQIIIIPEPNRLIHFHGLFNLKVLNGEVEILGATLSKSSPHKKIYSPRGTSLLYIKNTSKQNCSDTIKIKNLIASDLLNVEDKDLAFERHSAILLCQELKEPYIDFIESHMSQILFPEATSGPRVDFQIGGNWNKTMEYSHLWEDCMQDSKTVICGGKGVGKSTFLRYLVNLLLGKFPKVRIVDLDSGQSEFFAPGFIGIVTVEDNVLGPNYTHIQSADALILSHINIGHDIQQYSKSVKHLTEILDKMPPMPTLINFPGYTQGFGLDLSANSLRMLQPQIVIEIKSKNHSKNYKTDLTSDNINSYVGILGREEIQVSYQHFKFDSLCEQNDAWAIEARPSREICVLSYFGQMMSEGTKSLTSPDLNMFSINISAVNTVNFAGDVINPLVVNGCLVALCSLEQDDVFISYGLGLVRGLDLENDYLVLLTPEKDLDKVTHLVLTSVGTPPSLLMSAGGVRGNIPFVNKGELVDFGQFTKRSYLPPTIPKRG